MSIIEVHGDGSVTELEEVDSTPKPAAKTVHLGPGFDGNFVEVDPAKPEQWFGAWVRLAGRPPVSPETAVGSSLIVDTQLVQGPFGPETIRIYTEDPAVLGELDEAVKLYNQRATDYADRLKMIAEQLVILRNTDSKKLDKRRDNG